MTDSRKVIRTHLRTMLATSSGMTSGFVLGTEPNFYPLHRPETVESLFIAFRLTGNPYYREVGWKIFNAIQKFCRVETGGYASILNVDHEHTIQMDKMETFFLVRVLLARLDDGPKLTLMRTFTERDVEVSLPPFLG